LPQEPPHGGESSIVDTPTSAFDLPDRLAAKANAALISLDEQHFAAITVTLTEQIADLSTQLDTERSAPGGVGQQAMDRDLEIHRLTARLRQLRRFSLDLCLGRIVRVDDAEPIYIGRFGLTDRDGRRLLVDWRTPAAEPFFAATRARPLDVVSRRRYRWTRGRITDYWDEVFAADGWDDNAALDDESAFIASLGSSRSPRMRDVLGTIQADQDAIIRAGSRGALVVEGGPGTGKTVVALHRAAHLLYSDSRIARGGGGVLVVGPHRPYLAYVADVLPSLGEDSVQTCTVRDFVVEGATAAAESDPRVALLKSSADWATAIDRAVGDYEQPPSTSLVVETPWADLELSPDDWTDAFDAVESGTTHNNAREQVWDELIEILLDRVDDDAPASQVRRALVQNNELSRAFNRAWPLLDPAGVVSDLWSVPSFLQVSAPWLSSSEVRLLQRDHPTAWTVSDLPMLDAARLRIGDPASSIQRRRRQATLAAEREEMNRVVDELIEADDSELMLMSMLRGQDAQNSLVDESALPTVTPDLLAGPFAHIIVDEAQELTDAEWQMLVRRCPSRSFTIVGDRAQARHGFAESWRARLERVGLADIRVSTLTINYRTPEEVMREAEPVIRAALPAANVPTAIRSSGIPVLHASPSQLVEIVDGWVAAHPDGIGCVIGDPTFVSTDRVCSLTPELAKGLEFDLVILVDPDEFGTGIEGAVDRYVAMTRATQQLVILTSGGTGANRSGL
jgi:DNA helicase IV